MKGQIYPLPSNADELLARVRRTFPDAVSSAPWASLPTKSGRGFTGYGVMLTYNDVSVFCGLGAPFFFVMVNARPVGEFSFEQNDVFQGLELLSTEVEKIRRESAMIEINNLDIKIEEEGMIDSTGERVVFYYEHIQAKNDKGLLEFKSKATAPKQQINDKLYFCLRGAMHRIDFVWNATGKVLAFSGKIEVPKSMRPNHV